MAISSGSTRDLMPDISPRPLHACHARISEHPLRYPRRPDGHRPFPSRRGGDGGHPGTLQVTPIRGERRARPVPDRDREPAVRRAGTSGRGSRSGSPTGRTKGFSARSFRKKVRSQARRAGRKVIETALTLYFVWKDADTPRWAKATIAAALAYFVLPLDAVPDPLPGVGYVDDLFALIRAVAAIARHIKPEHREQAGTWAERKFGSRAPRPSSRG